MGAVTVTVVSRAKRVRADRERLVSLATRKAAFDIEGHAKERAPVDTGHLKASVQASGGKQAYRVDSHANYSVFVEFGTRRMAAQPYLVPAVERVRPSYLAALRSLA